MFAFFAIFASLLSVSLAVSAGYYRTVRASRIRLVCSLVLSVGGLACAVISALLFYRSAGAQLEWAENAFSMFTRFASWTTAAVTLVLILSVFFGTKIRDRIIRYAVCALFCVIIMMLTALFSSLANDPDTLVHSYVRAFGAGCACVPSVSFATEDVCFLKSARDSKTDKTSPTEKNNKKRK